tara:strand:- start:435 stop:656 length:222 start_codon:yes stop_codon:yes gene_type:complete
MIMIPKTKDDLTIDQKLDCIMASQITMNLKMEELEESLIDIEDSIKRIEIFNGATSQYLLKHLKYKKEEEAKK